MRLSIIITHYRNPELLKVCIDSVKKSLALEDYEIIVSDSATMEETVLMMRETYPEIPFIPSKENIGFSGTVNRALEKAQGDFILILNGDMIMKDDAIQKMLGYLEIHPEIGILGPQLLNFNETLQPSCFHFYTPLTIIYRRTFLGKLPFAKKHLDWFLMKDFDYQSIKEVDWIMGSSMMTSRKAVDKVGPMDESFKLYFEDTDWCRQFWQNGYKVVYYPEAQMYHYHGKGSAGKNVIQSLLFNKLTWLHIFSGIKYFLKYIRKPLPNRS